MALQQQLVRDRGELPPRRDISCGTPARNLRHQLDAFVKHRHFLLAPQCDRVLVRLAVNADLVPSLKSNFTTFHSPRDFGPPDYWITALRAPAIKALLDGGALQMSLFDDRDMAGIPSPEFPGERVLLCPHHGP